MKKIFYATACVIGASILIRCAANPSMSEVSEPIVTEDNVATPTMPLSAGQTVHPNGMYSTANGDSLYPGEMAHNTRVSNPYYLINPSLNPNVPSHLYPHSRLVLTDVEDRTFFDFFAWQTFVGLVWPADSDYRGVPDLSIDSLDFKNYNSSSDMSSRTPVVWETFRNFDDVFIMTDTTTPQTWNQTEYSRPFDLDIFSKMQMNEADGHPLIDQNHMYVRYNLQMNEVLYEFIRENKWYLKENLPKAPTQASLPPLPVNGSGQINPMQQPQTNTTVVQPVNGNSITLKSAWRLMVLPADTVGKPYKQVDDLSRYFVSKATVQDPVTGKDSVRYVGLVGLHVVVKTPQFTQGIWSSFEHVDNVKAPAGTRPSFNSGDTFEPTGYSYIPDPMSNGAKIVAEAARVPVEVSRIYKIPTTPVGTAENLQHGLSTVGLNKAFQELLSGTVWENYQLVITQWPTDPTTFYAKPFLAPRGEEPDANQPFAVRDAFTRASMNETNAYPRWSGLPIPQYGCLNTTMETYNQNPPVQTLESTSCMGCHYSASDMDYVWGLKLRTWPQNPQYGFDQGRINPADTDSLKVPANVED